MLKNDEIISERHVQAIWYDGTLRPDGLRTADGAQVRVVDPGRWNLEAGPDFLDAVLEIGGERRRVRGDVEVHVRAADWSAHGHGHDPAYAGVVAHVTWHPGPPPVSAHFQDGVPEVRSRLEVPAPGVDHAHRRAVRRAQAGGAQRPVVPDGLDVPFGDDFVVFLHKPSVPFSNGIHHNTDAARKIEGKLSKDCNGNVCKSAHGGTGETRTPNPRFRKPVLCPVELLSRGGRQV